MSDLLELLARHGAAVVFLATLAARIGAPVPAVPFLIVAGGLSVGGQVSFAAVALAAVLGNILGDGVWFLAGRRWGYRVMRLLCRISLSADSCVKRSESILGRWGGLSLIAAKFVPGVSVVAPPMAGALGMSNRRFLAYETAAALIWTLGFLLVGRLFHAAINDVLAVLSNIGLGALAVLALALVAFLAWRYRQRRMARRTDDIDHMAAEDLRAALGGAAPPVVVDVRTPQSRAIDARVIPGALQIEIRHLSDQLVPLSNGRPIVVFCDCPEDASAIAAARVLMAGGLPRVRVLAGGLDAWAAGEDKPLPAADTAPSAVWTT